MGFWIFGRKKIGLALSGGASRGISHVGVLKVIERYNIPIDCIAATSSGAVVGAFYASGLELPLIEEIALKLHWRSLIRVDLLRPGMISTHGIKDVLGKHLGDKTFSHLKIPLRVATTCLESGEPCVVKEGNVALAVEAATAFPGVFAPVTIDNRSMADGGISGQNLPVNVVKDMGANFVIASYVGFLRRVKKMPKDPIHVFERAVSVMMNRMAAPQRKDADILIEPHIEEEDSWHMDEKKSRRLIAEGERSAEDALFKLRRKY